MSPWVASLLLFCLLAAGGLVALGRYRDRVPRWGWALLDVVPVVLALVGLWLASHAFHELIDVPVKQKPQLLWAGAQLLVVLPALFWGRLGAIVSGVWLAVWGLIVLGDVWYFRFFGSLPSILAIGSGGHIWEIRDSAAAVTGVADLVLLPLVFLGVGMAVYFRTRRVVPHTLRGACSLLLACAFFLGATPALKDVQKWLGTRHSWKVFSAGRNVKNVGLWGTHFRDTAIAIREIRHKKELGPARFDEIKRYHEQRRTAQSAHFGQAKGANVLLLQVEALQEWAVEAKVNDQPVMPFLASLKRRGAYYENVWDLTGGSPTSDCEYMVLNSQHPLPRGAVAFRRAGNEFVTVAKVLADKGYHTYSAHAYERTMWNRAVVHPRYGFVESEFRDELGEQPELGWGLADDVFLTKSIQKLASLKAPWFGFLITLTSHHPYSYIPEEQQMLEFDGLGPELSGYLHSMRYVDDALKKSLAGLEESPALKNTLIVIYGDHDSKIKFNGEVVREAQRQLDLDDQTVRDLGKRTLFTKKVPLLIIPPGHREALRVSAIGGQIDIGPTVLDWLGIDKPLPFLGGVLADDVRPAGKTCVGCREAVRHDGSAVSKTLLWDGGKGRCYERESRKRVPRERCGRLEKNAAAELAASWDVTLNDLASKLDSAGARVAVRREATE